MSPTTRNSSRRMEEPPAPLPSASSPRSPRSPRKRDSVAPTSPSTSRVVSPSNRKRAKEEPLPPPVDSFLEEERSTSSEEEEEKESFSSSPPSPRVRRRRHCAEVCKKQVKKALRPIVSKREEENGESSKDSSDMREGSCDRNECAVIKSCSIQSEGCLGSRMDCGRLYTHISKGEHVCKPCYENIWTNGRPYFDRYMEWKARWTHASRCAPSLRSFIQDQMLPFWLACTECGHFRSLPLSAPAPSPSTILSFHCSNCTSSPDAGAVEAMDRPWITSLASAPLLHQSPALHYLHGEAYFYDELGMSPTNSEWKKEAKDLPSDRFMHPFNMPDEDSAVAFSLCPDRMEYDEMRSFPEYMQEQVPYLAARNLIVSLWAMNPYSYLTPSACLSQLVLRGLARVWFSHELIRIYEFLNIKGIINYGILDLPERPLTTVSSSPLEVVVVGAGISGLAAARQLRAAGATVKILEAKLKIGGRMQDDWSLGVAVGCGAQLVTGIVNNPIAIMCEQTKVGYRPLTEGCPLLDAKTGKRVEPRVDRIVDEQFNATLDTLGHWKDTTKAADSSLLEHIDVIHRKLLKIGAIRWAETEERVYQWNLGNTEFSCGAKLDVVSARHWDQNENLVQFAGAHALLTEGSSEIIKRLAEGTDIRHGAVVEKISWARDKRITLTCRNGRRFTADRVLVALPLSVLQKNVIEFVPALPAKKQKSINALGAGLIEKVAVRFPRRFWSHLIRADGTLDYFGHVPVDASKRGLFNMYYDFSSRGDSKREHFVLMSYVCGDSVNIVNELSDVEEMFGEEKIPDPTGYVVTHWGRDPAIGMSYSFVKVGATGDDYDELAVEVEGKVHFAGECTNRYFPQTMTGAYLSGIREAAKILEGWKKA